MNPCFCLYPVLHYLFWIFAVCLCVNLAVQLLIAHKDWRRRQGMFHADWLLFDPAKPWTFEPNTFFLAMWVIHLSSISLDFACVLWLSWLFVSYTRGTLIVSLSHSSLPFNLIIPLVKPLWALRKMLFLPTSQVIIKRDEHYFWKKMISWSVIALLGDLSTLLITKFGVAFGISNLISLGWGICTRITSKKIFEVLKNMYLKTLACITMMWDEKKEISSIKREKQKKRKRNIMINWPLAPKRKRE
jgi:hypothetical protein